MRYLASIASAALVLGTVAAPVLSAQNAPKRPRLDASADTNDWQAYYSLGMQQVNNRPDKAADAFYWAARLNPARAEPLYARWATLWMTKKELLNDYMAGAEFAVKSKDAQRFDTLYYQARLRNPFVHEGFYRLMLSKAYDAKWGEGNWEWAGDPENQAWLWYTEGKYDRAVSEFAKIMAHNPRRYGLHFDRARSFFAMQNYDSTSAELEQLLTEMEKRQQKTMYYFYNSRAMFHYANGIARIRAQDYFGARKAFEAALGEDLSFYPAHAALAGVALVQEDTATAVTEFDQAVQLSGQDEVLLHDYGVALIGARRYADAIPVLKKAAALNPDMASTHYYLGYALDASGDKQSAIAQYSEFARRAPRTAPELDTVRERLKQLAGS